MQGLEDTSILEDVADAEEEYDRPAQVACLSHVLRATNTVCMMHCCMLCGKLQADTTL